MASFTAMWEHFPEPACLLNQERTVLASNAIGRQLGMTSGIKCHSLNPKDRGGICMECRANEALENQKTVITNGVFLDMPVQSYWVPVAENAGLYIHFSIGAQSAIQAMRQKP